MWIKNQRTFATHDEIRIFMAGQPLPISLQADMTTALLAQHGFEPVTVLDAQYNPQTEKLAPGAPVKQDGKWVMQQIVVPLTAEEIKARVPHKVSRRQARQALLLAGLLDLVPSAIAAIPEPTQRRLAEIEWEDSLEFERARPLVIQIGTYLGLDETALDNLFIKAAKL